MLESRARQLRLRVQLRDPGAGLTPDSIACLHVPLAYPCRAGKLDPRNAPYVISLIDRAIAGCKAGEFAALTTAPVHKGVINDGGIAFIGHTEYLAERTGAAQVVMMLAGGGLRVALATTHLALKDVPRALTREGLERTIRVLQAELIRRFGVSAPRILVAGLNPHSGARKVCSSQDRCRRIRCLFPIGYPRPIAYLRCITIRACPCSSTRASAGESTSRSACP